MTIISDDDEKRVSINAELIREVFGDAIKASKAVSEAAAQALCHQLPADAVLMIAIRAMPPDKLKPDVDNAYAMSCSAAGVDNRIAAHIPTILRSLANVAESEATQPPEPGDNDE